MPGDWMSVSITPTRRPPAASNVERLAVMLDFPVPPRKEWIDTIVGMTSSPFSIPMRARHSTGRLGAVDRASARDTASHRLVLIEVGRELPHSHVPGSQHPVDELREGFWQADPPPPRPRAPG